MPNKEVDLAKVAEEMARSEEEINSAPKPQKKSYSKDAPKGEEKKAEPAPAPAPAPEPKKKVEVKPEPATAKNAKATLATTAKKPVEEVEKMSDAQLVKLFIETTGTATVVNEGDKAYPHAEAYLFLAYVKNTYPTIQEVREVTDEINKSVKRIYARAALKSLDGEHETLSTTTMCATTDEAWVAAKPNPFSSAYGLAQTRAIARLIRNQFGYIMAQAGFNETPYEEIDDSKMDLEAING